MKQLAICLAVFAAAVGAPQVARAGACASPAWSPQVLTPKHHVIPRDGGLLVGSVMGFGGGRYGSTNPSLTNWRLQRGQRSVRFRHKVLAPGLTLHIPTRRVLGTWQLVPRKNPRSLRFGGHGRKRQMAAPILLKAERYTSQWKNHRGYTRTSHHASVVIRGAAPKGAIGIILYRRAGSTWRPMLFKRVAHSVAQQKTRRAISVYTSPGRCGGTVPGLQVPVQGNIVMLRWVDQFGRLSDGSTARMVKQR